LLGVNKHEESFDSPYDRRSEVYRQLAYEYAKEHTQQQKQQPLWTVPNLLTFLRLVLVPVVMALWYAKQDTAQLLVAGLFVTASVTDWLDGFIARKVRRRCGLAAAGTASLTARAALVAQETISSVSAAAYVGV
jgi:CDP-diacylglycerol--glycerol-3-phosphate 3-phosphatidyltransferase